MKNVYKYALIASASLSLAACNNLIEPSETVDIERTITLIATREGTDSNTRSVRMEDGTTWWGPKEEISVFYGSGTNGGSKFTSNNTTLVETTEFEGSISMSGSKDFWAVYPYSSENSCDGSSVVTVIPSQQTGSEGNFADDAFPAIGKSSSLTMPFWNICGGIKFFVSRSDIKSVTFKGNAGETLAGKIRVAFNADGKPEVAEVLDGKTEVTLNAPDGGTFKAGKSYYITLLPTALDGGFTMTFNTADEKGTFSSDKAQTVKRSIFGVLKNIDSKVSEWESTVVAPEWVDLGLSVKWATYNVGATKPEEYGDYFAWGETEPKSNYSWENYKFNLGTTELGPFSKYDYGLGAGYKQTLDLEDDAAYINWGGNWRMPTIDEWGELRDNCNWIYTTENDINGWRVYSKKAGFTETFIFIPAAGSGNNYYVGESAFYWSSTIGWSNNTAYHLWIADSAGFITTFDDGRSSGRSIRPVYDERMHPESVSLNKSHLTLFVGDSEQLAATIMPSNAKDQTVRWSSNNTDVATVDVAGIVTAISAGTATITVTTNDGEITATCEVTVSIPEPEYVDLGLSVQWATFNVGATKPEEYGDYFAWGETEPKSDYSWSTYKWCNGSYRTLTKYNTNSSFGTVDNKTVLDPEDDAAHVNWGGSWRMPTDAELTELRTKCTWTWTTQNGVNGRKVTGPNGNSIFLPAAGYRGGSSLGGAGFYGDYWSSSLNTDYPSCACCVDIDSGNVARNDYGRDNGFSVRPVYGEIVPVASITLNESSLNLIVNSSAQLVATITPSNATESSVRWVSSDESIATVDENGNVTAVALGNTTVTAYASNGLSASCDVTVKEKPTINGYEYVDLGLPSGLKWATMNVGATKPEEYGDYFAWGETEPKSNYDWSTYKYELGTDHNGPFSKYVTQSSYGTVDNITVLTPEDDAAYAKWGGSWRMPTNEEWTELINNCTWTWTSNYNGTGIAGRIVTSDKDGYTDKSIFLPAAGFRDLTYLYTEESLGNYWSSSLGTDKPSSAWRIYFSSDAIYRDSYNFRVYGHSIRPVSE